MYAKQIDGKWQRFSSVPVLGNTYNPTEEMLLDAGYYHAVDSVADGVVTGYMFDRLDGDKACFVTQTRTEEQRVANLCEAWVRDVVGDMLVLLNSYSVQLPVASIRSAINEIATKAEAAGSPYDIVRLSAMYNNLRLNGISDDDIPAIAQHIAEGN